MGASCVGGHTDEGDEGFVACYSTGHSLFSQLHDGFNLTESAVFPALSAYAAPCIAENPPFALPLSTYEVAAAAIRQGLTAAALLYRRRRKEGPRPQLRWWRQGPGWTSSGRLKEGVERP